MKKIKVIDVVMWIIIIMFLINTGIAYLSYNRVINKKEPFFTFNKQISDNKIIYNEALYKIVVEEDSKIREVSLKVFFLK